MGEDCSSAAGTANHVSVSLDDGTEAYLSTREARAAMVFVHGVFGRCDRSWGGFRELCDLSDEMAAVFANIDLYFYEYGAERDLIQYSAGRLDDFLTNIYPTPPEDLFGHALPPESGAQRTALREKPVVYDRLILVGHSLGCVIIRKACLRILQRPLNDLDSSREWTHAGPTERQRLLVKADKRLEANLALFAPAHKGIQAWKLADHLTRVVPGLEALKLLYTWKSLRVYEDLLPESMLLKNLEQDTVEYRERFPAIPALNARSLFGREEYIVNTERFRSDLPEDYEDGKDHVTINKPTKDYLRPLEYVTYGFFKQSASV